VGRIQRGKGDKYRETSLTYSLAATINADTDVRDGGPDDSLISRTTRTVRDWVTTIGERLAADTGDEGWTSVEPHDLRRTWGTLLVDEAEPGLVMEWGSREDWETFREVYLGTYSTKAKIRARENVDWLEYITTSSPSTSRKPPLFEMTGSSSSNPCVATIESVPSKSRRSRLHAVGGTARLRSETASGEPYPTVGRATINTAPSGSLSSTRTSPPYCSTSVSTRYRPTPVPELSRSVSPFPKITSL
jgi:hypothetical protein